MVGTNNNNDTSSPHPENDDNSIYDSSRNDISFESNYDSNVVGHRRAFSTIEEAEHALPQLTSPLSPPAFNPGKGSFINSWFQTSVNQGPNLRFAV